MSQYRLRAVIIEVLGKKFIDGVAYQECRIRVAGMEIVAYLSRDINASANAHFGSNEYYITFQRKRAEKPRDRELALRIEKPEIIKAVDFEPIENLDITISNCTIKKSRKAELKMIGAKKNVAFIPCSIVIPSEEKGKSVYVMLVNFNDNARIVDKLEKPTQAEVDARLKISKDGSRFELNTTSITINI